MKPLKIAILHNAVAESDLESDRDVLVQVEAVEKELHQLGHSARRIACTLNLETVEESLVSDRPAAVINLVESLGGSDRLAHLAAVLLEDLDLPFTGNSAAALHLTNNKPLSKQRMRDAGLPTPDWVAAFGNPAGSLAPPYIIKAVWEHASLGLDDHAVIRHGDGSTVIEQIESRARQLGQQCFAEQFVEGREFNLSLLAGTDGPHILPPAEIDFSAFPKDKARIVGYAAKWKEGAFEFENTPRRFEFPQHDQPLLDWLRSLSVQSWELFDLRGYARVDFRIDAKGSPWILEVNANPCLSPDAGFAAALKEADVPLERAIQWILEDALRPKARLSCSLAGADSKIVPARSNPLLRPAAVASKKSRRPAGVKLRSEPVASDAEAIRRIVNSSALFRPAEVDVAVELLETRLAKGLASGYEFIFAEQKTETVGYACFGPNTLTVSSWDLFWIAVDKAQQGSGIGRILLETAEAKARAAGGTRLYIETSHRADYMATRGFYENCGYRLEAVLEDFYAPGDSKAIYVKVLK